MAMYGCKRDRSYVSSLGHRGTWSRWATSARAAEAYNPQSLRHEAEARGGDQMGRVPQNGLGKGKARQGGRQEDALRAGETAISLGLPNRTSHRTFALRLGVVTVYLFSSVSYSLTREGQQQTDAAVYHRRTLDGTWRLLNKHLLKDRGTAQ